MQKKKGNASFGWPTTPAGPERRTLPSGPHLLAVLADVGVDLVEGAEHVELTGVKAGLFSQIGIHILITDGRQAVDVSVVPETHTHTHSVSQCTVDFPPHLDSVLLLWKVIKPALLKEAVSQRREIREGVPRVVFLT